VRNANDVEAVPRHHREVAMDLFLVVELDAVVIRTEGAIRDALDVELPVANKKKFSLGIGRRSMTSRGSISGSDFATALLVPTGVVVIGRTQPPERPFPYAS